MMAIFCPEINDEQTIEDCNGCGKKADCQGYRDYKDFNAKLMHTESEDLYLHADKAETLLGKVIQGVGIQNSGMYVLISLYLNDGRELVIDAHGGAYLKDKMTLRQRDFQEVEDPAVVGR